VVLLGWISFERAPFSVRREDETIDIFMIFYDYKTQITTILEINKGRILCDHFGEVSIYK
jgi:hypothetical protein